MPFDAGKPNIARAYGYILGGKDHSAPDRALAERILAIYPGARQMARENRRFLGRALDYVLVQGISQYVDLGAGLPTSPAVHQIVRRHSTRAAVAYVDNDPVVLTHLHALAAHGDHRIREVAADLAAPAATLAALDATGLIGWDSPCCLILGMVLHFQPAADAAAITAAYVSALAPGSYVIISIGRGEEQVGSRVTAAYDAAPLFNHSPQDMARFFTGLDLVPPGIVDARAWMPGWPAPPYMFRAGQVLAGVGRKP
jgi:O-methyltransferase involved in polyketide biosynthesis